MCFAFAEMSADSKTVLDVWVAACSEWTDLDVIIAGIEAEESENWTDLDDVIAENELWRCVSFFLHVWFFCAIVCLCRFNEEVPSGAAEPVYSPKRRRLS